MSPRAATRRPTSRDVPTLRPSWRRPRRGPVDWSGGPAPPPDGRRPLSAYGDRRLPGTAERRRPGCGAPGTATSRTSPPPTSRRTSWPSPARPRGRRGADRRRLEPWAGRGAGRGHALRRPSRRWSTGSVAPARRAGLWLAPFLVGAETTLAREHPDWLIGPAGSNWGQDSSAWTSPTPGFASCSPRTCSGWSRWASTTSNWTSCTPARLDGSRRLSLRARADPRGRGARCLPGRLWCTPAAQRRAGRRHARLPRHLPRGR